MLYERSLTIEQRLTRVLKLIESGHHSASTLAIQLGVSIPTVSRCILALRQRGHVLRAIKYENGWTYELEGPTDGKGRLDPLEAKNGSG